MTKAARLVGVSQYSYWARRHGRRWRRAGRWAGRAGHAGLAGRARQVGAGRARPGRWARGLGAGLPGLCTRCTRPVFDPV